MMGQEILLSIDSAVYVKVKVRDIAVRNVTSPHHYDNSYAILDHTVLLATWQR